MRQIKLTRASFWAHDKITSRIVLYADRFGECAHMCVIQVRCSLIAFHVAFVNIMFWDYLPFFSMLRLLLANNDLLYNTADNNNLNAPSSVVHLMDCGSADKTANCSGSESPRSALLSVIDWPIALGQWSMRSDADSCVSDAVYTRSIYWSQQTTGEKLSDDSVQPSTVVRGVDPMCFSGSGLEHSNSLFESIRFDSL